MKTKSFKIAYWMTEFIYYSFITISLIGLIFITVNTFKDGETKYSIGYFKSVDMGNSSQSSISLKVKSSDYKNAKLVSDKWKVSFNTDNWKFKALHELLFVFVITYFFAILYLLRRIILSLKLGSPFTKTNIKRLKQIGIMIIIIEPLRWIIKYIFHQWASFNFDITFVNQTIGYQIGYYFGSSDYIQNWIFTGLLILVIAEVFNQGLKMKEEQDLTI